MQGLVSDIAWLVDRVANRLLDAWSNWIGRTLVVAGPETRFLRPSRVLNPRRQRELITVGARTVVRGEIFCFAHGGRVRIGDDCFIGEGTRIWSADRVEIGNRVLVSHGVDIQDTSGHPTRAVERAAHFAAIRTKGHPPDADFPAKPVRIGDDAWIGFRAAIRPGVSVGRGAIVGAMSVVTADVPDYAVVVGNPARIVRTLGPDER